MLNVTVNIYRNPLTNEKETEEIKPGESFIDYLLKRFPNGFQCKTSIYLNNVGFEIDYFDIILKPNDVIDISFLPQGGPVENIITFGAVGLGLTVGRPATVSFSPNTNTSLETTPEVELVKSPTYNLREQVNLARYDESIPSQYGKIKWAPDLACLPYTRFENNLSVVRHLLCLGHGEHQIDDIMVGDTSIINSTQLSYTLFNPGEAMTAFNDDVFTHPDVNRVSFKSPIRVQRHSSSVSFDATAKTITFPNTDNELTNIFSDDDEIYIFSPNIGVGGEYVIDTVTDDVITVTSSASGFPHPLTPPLYAVVYLKEDVIENPLRQYYGLNAANPPYLNKTSTTGVFDFNNSNQENAVIEIDLEYVNGLYTLDTDAITQLVGDTFESGVVIVPVDDDGDVEDFFYSTYPDQEMDLDTGNTYVVTGSFGAWVNDTDLTGIVFPTISTFDIAFKEDDVTIDPSDISSIDYINRKVTFLTSKTGVITVDNPIYYVATLAGLGGLGGYGNFNPGGGGVTLINDSPNTTRITYSREIFITTSYECSIPKTARVLIYNYESGFTGNKMNTTHDSGTISRVKFRFSDTVNYPNVSLLALENTSSSLETAEADSNLNIISTRKLIQWSGSAWSTPIATRSIIWALADVWMSTYGASRSDLDLDLTTLLTLETTFSSRGDTFDAVFDNTITVWEALKRIGNVGRTEPIFDGTQLTFVRDEARSIFRAIYGIDNMIKGSFNIGYKLPDAYTPDSVYINYFDEDNLYRKVRVYSNSEAYLPRSVDMFGVVNYEQAWRQSQYLEKKIRTQYVTLSFETELVGHIPFYGDYISVQYDLPSWGQSGKTVSKVGTSVISNQPLDWSGGGPFSVLFMEPDGSASGPHTVTQGADDYIMILDTDVTDFTFITENTNKSLTVFHFGTTSNYSKPCIITAIKPASGNNRVKIECVPYIASIYTADEGTPPDKQITTASPVVIPPVIGGLTLSNVPGSGSVVVNWNPALNVDNYKVQKSTDNITYTDVSTPSVTTETISATGTLYVRVASVISSVVSEYVKQSIVAS